jgi:hypothetical protein
VTSGRIDPVRTITPVDLTGIVSCGTPVLSADGRGYAYTYRRVLNDLILASGFR